MLAEKRNFLTQQNVILAANFFVGVGAIGLTSGLIEWNIVSNLPPLIKAASDVLPQNETLHAIRSVIRNPEDLIVIGATIINLESTLLNYAYFCYRSLQAFNRQDGFLPRGR